MRAKGVKGNDFRAEPGTWTEVVFDTEAEIRRLELRLERLRRVLVGAKAQIADGVPFPGEGAQS